MATNALHRPLRIARSILVTALLVSISASQVCLACDRRLQQEPSQKAVQFPRPVCRDKKWGFIDTSGKLVITPQFDEANSFSEGLARVRLGRGYAYVRVDGSIAFHVSKDDYPRGGFQEGRVSFFRNGGKVGFLDREGNVAVPPIYDDVGDFHDARAWVLVDNDGLPINSFGPPKGRIGFVDLDGKMVIPTDYVWGSEFSEGLAKLWRVGVEPRPRAEFVDTDGKVALKVDLQLGKDFDTSASQFSEGLCGVRVDGDFGCGRRYAEGFIDRSGKLAILLAFEEVADFSEGMAAARVSNKWGYVDPRGAWVVSPAFDEAEQFHEGHARVRLGTQWMFVDRRGCLISARSVRCKCGGDSSGNWNDAGSFFGGLALVHIGGTYDCSHPHQPCRWEGGAWYYIDDKGAVVTMAYRDDDR